MFLNNKKLYIIRYVVFIKQYILIILFQVALKIYDGWLGLYKICNLFGIYKLFLIILMLNDIDILVYKG